MKILRRSSEDEMILEFLSAELESIRFRDKMIKVLKTLQLDEEVIIKADLNNDEENIIRKRILACFRGYGRNEELFERFPTIKTWFYAQCEQSDLDNIHYINYSYWNELSKNTGLPKVAAQTINAGIMIYDIPNDAFLRGRDYLLKGNSFRPVILITSNMKNFIIVEGHSRMTSYALIPEKFNGTYCYVGICDDKELKNWYKN